MKSRHNGQEDPGSDPEPPAPHRPPRLVEVWLFARTALQLVELLSADKHEGLHLAVQALVVIGDVTVGLLASDPDR